MLTTRRNGFKEGYFKIYKELFEKHISKHSVSSDNPFVVITEHYGKDGNYVVAINGTDREINPELTLSGCKIKRIIKGDKNLIEPYGALVFEIERW